MKAVACSLGLLTYIYLASSPQASAAPYGTAGCGLGSIVIGSKPGMMQIFAATTNGTSASQSFGITSGTSNCVDHGSSGSDTMDGAPRGDDEGMPSDGSGDPKPKKKKKRSKKRAQIDFLENNFYALSKDMARGEGDALATFTHSFECPVSTESKIATLIKNDYSEIFAETESATIVDTIYQKLAVMRDMNDCGVAI